MFFYKSFKLQFHYTPKTPCRRLPVTKTRQMTLHPLTLPSIHGLTVIKIYLLTLRLLARPAGHHYTPLAIETLVAVSV
jgi:hypothetical protein